MTKPVTVKIKMTWKELLELQIKRHNKSMSKAQDLNHRMKAELDKTKEELRAARHDLGNQKQIVLFQKDKIAKLKGRLGPVERNIDLNAADKNTVSCKVNYLKGQVAGLRALLHKAAPFVQQHAAMYTDAKELYILIETQSEEAPHV